MLAVIEGGQQKEAQAANEQHDECGTDRNHHVVDECLVQTALFHIGISVAHCSCWRHGAATYFACGDGLMFQPRWR